MYGIKRPVSYIGDAPNVHNPYVDRSCTTDTFYFFLFTGCKEVHEFFSRESILSHFSCVLLWFCTFAIGVTFNMHSLSRGSFGIQLPNYTLQ
jgi:hypothetical protein